MGFHLATRPDAKEKTVREKGIPRARFALNPFFGPGWAFPWDRDSQSPTADGGWWIVKWPMADGK
jgi:hypothetical protein